MRLTRNEDGQLRRLHFFEQRGAVLADTLREQLLFLRARDARAAVREPWETVQLGEAPLSRRRPAAPR